MLQWGRARAGAEFLLALVAEELRDGELQWGRARAGAELQIWTRSALREVMLQWGRARAGAELIQFARTSGTSNCFNGAAPARARNYDPQDGSGNSQLPLQWGRGEYPSHCRPGG